MTPAQQREAERVLRLFQGALNEIGLKATEDALTLWGQVPPVPSSQSGDANARWLRLAVRYVSRRRLRARDLALAYYRYQRALSTGSTIRLPGETQTYYSIPELQRQFEALLNPEAPTTPQEGNEGDSGDSVKAEDVSGLNEALAQNEELSAQEIETVLKALGTDNLDRKLAQVTDDDAGRQEAHREAGRRQAAAVARVTMNGGRSALYTTASLDPKAIGWARVSTTGTPCGFCAMLISRGAVYKSESSASLGPDQDLYHDNCHCIAVPIFSREDYRSNPVFDTNREYAALWPKVTKGLGGKAALAEWRAYFRSTQAQSQKAPEAAA